MHSLISDAPLPALPFGEAYAQVFDDPVSYTSYLRDFLPRQCFERLEFSQEPFQAKVSWAAWSDLTVIGFSSKPRRLSLTNGSYPWLLLNTSHENPVTDQNVHVTNAYWVPANAQTDHLECPSGIGFVLEPRRMEQTLKNMLQQFGSDMSAEMDLSTMRTLDLKPGSVHTQPILQSVAAMLDACATVPNGLTLSGLDEVIYRCSVMLLRPDLISVPTPPLVTGQQVITRQRLVERLCDYMRTHMGQKVSIEDLKALTGLSGRSIQYAFEAQLAVSPMQWLREQRLQSARQLLLHSTPKTTMTAIALECGFSSSSSLSSSYAARFGESPSATRRAVLKQPLSKRRT